jgi:hypothetical protein
MRPDRDAERHDVNATALQLHAVALLEPRPISRGTDAGRYLLKFSPPEAM